jgi:hypothetical protein
MVADSDVSISSAPSSRSSCQSCKESIQKDTLRVTMPGRHNGLSVNKYLHPKCFADRCVAVDYAPTNRAKCAGDGRPLAKGQMRLTMVMRNCQGNAQSTKLFHPPNAAAFLKELVGACDDGRTVEDFTRGIEDAADRKWALDAFNGVDVSGLPVPTRDAKSEAKPRSTKKRQRQDARDGDNKKSRAAISKARDDESDDDDADVID